jgi:peptide/nickel transport system permease protein
MSEATLIEQPDPTAQTVPRVPRSKSAWGALIAKPVTAICLAIAGLFLLAGVLSCFGFMNDLAMAKVGNSYDPPHLSKPALWLGTDILGRSILWRTIYGTRVALIITAGASILSLGIGTILGICAGYFGGWVDVIITWLFTTINSIPWILLVVGITFALQGHEFANGETIKDRYGDLPAIIAALGLTGWVGLCRLLRGEVLKLRASDYIQAARASGAGTFRILFRHIFPNVRHLIIITFSLSAVAYVQAEVALTFIGIGISEKPSWGRMITDAKLEILRGVWWQMTAASSAIFLLSISLNLIGDSLSNQGRK